MDPALFDCIISLEETTPDALTMKVENRKGEQHVTRLHRMPDGVLVEETPTTAAVDTEVKNNG